MRPTLETSQSLIYVAFVDARKKLTLTEIDPVKLPEEAIKDIENKVCLIEVPVIEGDLNIPKLEKLLSKHGVRLLRISECYENGTKIYEIYVQKLQVPTIYLLPSILIAAGLLVFAIAVLVFMFKVPGEWIAAAIIILLLPVSIAIGYSIIKYIQTQRFQV